LFSTDILRTRGSSDVLTFWRKKLPDFFEIYGVSCPHGQGGRELSQCGHSADKGGGD